MSAKNSHTTADYLPWDSAINLVHRLYRDKKYRMSLFVATGIFTLLRVSDLRRLTWNDLMGGEILTISEQKTKKRRVIKLNMDFIAHVRDCYKALGIKDANEPCFLSQKKSVFSTQRLNVMLKEMKKKYRLPIQNISCHSLRKTGGRRIWENSDENKEYALIKLSEVLAHSNCQVTRRYLGIKQQEILDAYDYLTF